MSLIPIPILGGVVDADEITMIRRQDGQDFGRGMCALPRVIIDTRQMVGAFVIECDSHQTMIGVLNEISMAARAARQAEPVKLPADQP